MEGYLCHCAKGKGKEKEVIKIKEAISELEYTSDDKYHTAPNTRGATIIELIPINIDEGEGMMEGDSWLSGVWGRESSNRNL